MKRHLEKGKSFFTKNRKEFVAQMKKNSIAIFHSGDQYLRSADANHDFFQDPDFYYLTGIDQEESILILFPDSPHPAQKEILLLKETNDYIKVWEGQKYTQEDAQDLSGIKNCIWNSGYENTLNVLMHYAENVYIPLNEHDRAHFDGDYKNLRELNRLKAKYPSHNFERATPILSKLRTAKKPDEIMWMQAASDITIKTFVKMLKEFKKFKTEHEIEAFLTYQFMLNKATHAYSPIIASAENSCVLHYIDNNKPLKQGEILLMDFGCSYSNYASDMSRTIPISGRYTERQKEVYNACLGVFKEVKAMMKSGLSLNKVNLEATKVMESYLVQLKLISIKDIKNQEPNRPAYKKYFPHGTSHFIGLNVHDVGNKYNPMPENTVLTCEPGIYIEEEKLGIRIENDFVVKKTGVVDLFENCPIEVEEIEDLMN